MQSYVFDARSLLFRALNSFMPGKSMFSLML